MKNRTIATLAGTAGIITLATLAYVAAQVAVWLTVTRDGIWLVIH